MFNNRSPLSSSSSTMARNSFSRISDYLCEEILMYLPPEDKIRLEYVSQQFKRTIFRRQYRFVIAPSCNEWSKVKNILLKRFVGDFNVIHKIDIQLFDKILSKFRYIDDFAIHYNLDTSNMDEIFECLMRHCVRIRRMDANFFNVSEKTLDAFGKRFGHSLRVVKSSIVSNTKIPNSFALLKHCSNLVSLNGSEFLNEKLWNNVFNTILDNDYTNDENNVETEAVEYCDEICLEKENSKDVVLPNLKSCYLKVINEEGVNQLEKFSDVYMNRLEKIKVELVDYIARHHYMVNFIFPLGICKFRNLRECILTLKYNGGYDADFLWINNGLDGIAQDCKKIQHLGIDFIGHQDFFINHVLQALTCFKTLPHLSISISMYNKGLNFPVMPSLNQLDLAYPRLYQCTHLKQLVYSFPNCNTLHLQRMYFFNDVLLNSLIGLKKLQTLRVGGLCSPDVSTIGLKTFLNAAPQIRSIGFDTRPKIDTKTFEMIIDFVQKHENIYYDFDFCLQDFDPNEKKEFEQFFNNVQLPKNLSIK
ncbi:hypothetical protein DERP_012983 [Dermatophagoides pteronyssinus]|uniref:F-box domain-containing protein n=1 Tax=Dermatophagoides pteronyssinus TaxID=6956 RepID=A0ABQ8ISH3_DERPT|nr:hypothetical protein DERP_012983 [Dermatophagoides pteronyssinus]